MALAATKEGSSGCNAESRSSGSSGSIVREPAEVAVRAPPLQTANATRAEDAIAEAEADIAHVVNELRNTTPSWLARLVAQYPGKFLVLVLLACILCSIPAVVFYPKIDTSFENLTIRDHPLRRDLDIYNTLRADADDFWQPLNATAPSRRLLTANDITNADISQDLLAPSSRRLLSPGSSISGGALDGAHDWQAHGGRRLHQSNYYPKHTRSFVEWTLHVVYHRKDDANMLDPATIAKMKAVENELIALPSYGRLCVHETYDVCRRPLSFVNYVYGQIMPDGTFRADASGDKQNDPIVVARLMASQNFTWLFGDDIDYVAGTTSTLRTELMFGRPADGFPADDISRTTALYKSLCKDMYDVLRSHIDDDLRINFGGEVMTDWEIRKTLFRDGLFAFAACGLVIVLLALSTRSPFLTLIGTFQLLIAFPLAYALYASRGYRYLGIIQFLAPFVTLGIGLDDIFVFIGTYKLIMQHSGRFSLATRLQLAFKRSSQAMLATSATSAAAFASNIISPVPAVAVFGLLLALLVTVNFILVVTWTPVCVVFWDRYLANRCKKGGKPPKILPDEDELAFQITDEKSWASAPPGPIAESRDAGASQEYPTWVPTVQPSAPPLPEPTAAHSLAPHQLYVPHDSHHVHHGYHGHPAPAHAPPGVASGSNRHLRSASFGREHLERSASGARAAANTRDAYPHQLDGDCSMSESHRSRSCTPEDMHYAHMTVAAAPPRRFFDVRRFWGRVFDLIWASRFPCIALFVAAVVVGAIFASRLEKSDSVPALFPHDTNVQYFLDVWYKNYSSDSVFGCPQCIGASSTIVTIPGLGSSPPSLGAPASPSTPPTATAAGTPSNPPIGGATQSDSPPPLAAPPPPSPVASGTLPGFTPPTATANGPPAPSPPAATSPLDPTYIDPNSSVNTINVDPNSINNTEVKENTIKTQLIWGPTGSHDSSSDPDPFAPLKGVVLEYDLFDLSTVEQQTAVYAALDSLFTSNGTSKQSLLATIVSANVLDAFKAWCTGATGRGSPCKVDPTTKLPTGDQFHIELWQFLNSGGSAADVRSWRRLIGYDTSVAPNFQLVTSSNVPRARWLRIEVATATTSVAPSSAILDSYNSWQDWADSIREATNDIGHFRVAANEWAVSVTQQAITQSIAWSLIFSTTCAIVTVLVITGSFIVTGLAALTLMGINIWMLGLYQMIGWKLGAIEGISITFLMGISVDFCIHISDAYVHSRRVTRYERARDALQWMGGAMLESGMSTLIVALPLIFATTLVLKRFAIIIGASMLASLAFTYLFNVPMLGMLGPMYNKDAGQGNCLSRAINFCWRSSLNRAALCCAIILAIIPVVPKGMDILKQELWLPIVLGVIVVLPFVRAIYRAVSGRGCGDHDSAGGH